MAENYGSPRSPRGKGEILVVNVKEKNPVDEIDTKGAAVVHPSGGKIIFRCVEVKDTKTKSSLLYTLKLDDEEKYHCKSQKGKDEKFEHEGMQEFTLEAKNKLVTVEIKTQGFVGKDYLGEVRIPVEELLNGFPYDQWYPLTNKAGKDDKKIKGEVHIMINYFPKGREPTHNEFTSPLINLIDLDRIDIFEKKVTSLGSKHREVTKEKGYTPLLHAAAAGKASFVKILVEKGSSIMDEKDNDGRNAIHLAALYGRLTCLRYLIAQKGIDIDAKDGKGETAIHLAAAENQAEAVLNLVRGGANPNSPNGKKDTPLFRALIETKGAPKAVEMLLACGADVYADTSEGILKIWEVAQRKDLTSSSQNRRTFMRQCDVVEPREFALQQKLPIKQRISGTGFSTDWETATQFVITAPDPGRQITILVYSETRTDECSKEVNMCVVKDKAGMQDSVPSFQPEGIDFGTLGSFNFFCEPEHSYIVCSYSTNKLLDGEFGMCVFQEKGEPVKVAAAKKWEHVARVESEWKEDNAKGSAFPEARKNPSFDLSAKSDTNAFLMIHQKSKDVSAIIFDDKKIMPSKFYVGMHVLDEEGNVYAKSEKWHNSKEVYLYVSLKKGKKYIVLPSTRNPNEEGEFTLSVHSHQKATLKSKD